MAYPISHIASIIRSKTTVTSATVIMHLLTDSRKLVFPESTLFFALSGPQRDGHQFISELYNKGLRYFVVSKELEIDKFPDAIFLQVADTLLALQTLTAWHRKQFQLPVIGITGSNGKTIVKEWLNQLLDPDHSIIRSPKSYNSQIGVPLSVWPLQPHHTVGIFEAGISQSGEMERLQKIIQPTIGVFTNIGAAHGEGFLNIRQKVNEKLRLFTGVDVLFYCKDDPEVHSAVAGLWQQVSRGAEKPMQLINWSMVSDASLHVLTVLREEAETTITAEWEKRMVQIRIPFTDAASVENAILCWTILLHFGVPDAEIEKRMKKLGAVAMRLELKKAIHHCSVINDSYSADLNSLRMALDFLVQQQQHEKRTVILSDLLQSGQAEKVLYEQVAGLLEQRSVNRLIGIGERIYAHQSLFNKIKGLEANFFHTVESFKAAFHSLHFRDEVILLKGARVFEFERIDRLLELQDHQTVLDINLTTIASNLQQYRQTLKAGTKIMAMVKAFAYGSGSFEIANLLQFHKVDYLAVAYIDEGVELRKAGIHLPIMVMNPEAAGFDSLLEYNLEPDLFSAGILKQFVQFLRQQGVKQFPVHIELETGMHRLGFSSKELPYLLDVLKQQDIKIQSVFSHLVASESAEHDAFTKQQAASFHQMANVIAEHCSYPFLKHIANTSGISRHSDLQMDMVRLGIGLYGIDPGKTTLTEASTLKSTIAQIKTIAAGSSVGYGRKAVVQHDSLIATVRIGYADGYPRSLSNGAGRMLVRGVEVPVIGSICMDMTMLDVSNVTGITEGDPVVVFGPELSVTKVANWAGTIPYEILTGVSGRVKRVYFEE